MKAAMSGLSRASLAAGVVGLLSLVGCGAADGPTPLVDERTPPFALAPLAPAPSDVSGEALACGAGDIDCADRFIYTVTGVNGELAQALAPLARRLLPYARDVRVSAWTPSHDGVAMSGAVTLYGHRDGQLVGIVVFR